MRPRVIAYAMSVETLISEGGARTFLRSELSLHGNDIQSSGGQSRYSIRNMVLGDKVGHKAD